MKSSVYNGDRRKLTLETYYTIILKAFNDLAAAVSTRHLNDTKRINEF